MRWMTFISSHSTTANYHCKQLISMISVPQKIHSPVKWQCMEWRILDINVCWAKLSFSFRAVLISILIQDARWEVLFSFVRYLATLWSPPASSQLEQILCLTFWGTASLPTFLHFLRSWKVDKIFLNSY